MFRIDQFWFRLLVVLAIVASPFIRMLLQHDYGFLHVEIAALLLLLTVFSAAVAGVLFKRWMFHAGVAVLLIVLTTGTLQAQFLPLMRLRYLVFGIVLVFVTAVLLMKEQFYPILLVFIAGMLSVDVATAVLKRPAPATASTAQNAELQHVVHVILDGMIGLGGMPPDIGECTTAANHFRKVLESGAFDIYPYAFSNYTYTRDSLPSILNGRLLKHHGEFPTSSSPGSVLHENLYFDELRRRGYRIRVYQSDWLRFASGNSDTVQTREYKGSSLNPLHDLPLSWQARLGQLFAVYIDSDRHWSYWSTNRMPAIARRIPLGALTSKRMWPEQIVADYRSAAQKTLFFVHLMMPHTPYVYTAEGSITDPEGWSHETEFPSDQRSQYNDHYRRYCGQVYFTATQLQRFLDGLKSTRSYNSTTVIIHGDHGSRLRSVSPDDQRVVHQVRSMPGSSLPVVRYDYASEPDAASLVNRFSTLFATKKAGATMPRVVPEVGSVLHFLRQEFPFSRQLDTADALNSVYMFNPDGSPRPIRTMTKALSTRTRDEVPVEYQNKGEGNEREGQQ